MEQAFLMVRRRVWECEWHDMFSACCLSIVMVRAAV